MFSKKKKNKIIRWLSQRTSYNKRTAVQVVHAMHVPTYHNFQLTKKKYEFVPCLFINLTNTPADESSVCKIKIQTYKAYTTHVRYTF